MALLDENVTIGAGEHYWKWDTWKSAPDSKWVELTRPKIKDGKRLATPKQDSNNKNLSTFQKYKEYSWDESIKDYKPTGNMLDSKAPNHYADTSAAKQGAIDPTSTNYGAEQLTQADFLDPAGGQLPIEQVVQNLKAKFPGKDEKQIRAQVNDMMPKFQGMQQEDFYGLQKDAKKAGAAMRGAFTGMGARMREGLDVTKDITAQVGQAAREKAGEFMGEAGKWIGGWGFKHGGRVPKKKSFLEALTKLPDAGGR